MHEHQPEGCDFAVVCHAAQVIEDALPRIEREHHAVRLNRARETEGEMARAGTEIANDHAGSDIEGRDHRVRVAQPILTRSAGIQPSPHRSWQAIEHHPRSMRIRSAADLRQPTDVPARRATSRSWPAAMSGMSVDRIVSWLGLRMEIHRCLA